MRGLKYMLIKYLDRWPIYIRRGYVIGMLSRKIFYVILILMYWGFVILEVQNNWWKDRIMYAIFARGIIELLNSYLAINITLLLLMFGPPGALLARLYWGRLCLQADPLRTKLSKSWKFLAHRRRKTLKRWILIIKRENFHRCVLYL